jgi:hypothetical protein
MKPLFILIALLGLTACYEDTDVTIYEPGVYKGSQDEHALSAEERAEVLAKRFNQVQTDR